jgi:disulfide bond formation protein DsbB
MTWLDAAPRRVLAGVAAGCVAMLAFGLYLQHVVGLNPCPMCIVQRYCLIGVALAAALGAVWRGRLGPARFAYACSYRSLLLRDE